MSIRSENRAAFLALAGPGALLYAAIIVFPVLFSAGASFTDWTATSDAVSFVGFANFKEMFADPFFAHSLRNNLLVVAVSVFVQIPAGFAVAYVLHRKLVAAKSLFEAMLFLPVTISPVVVAVLWSHIFSPAGIVTALMRRMTGDPRFVFAVFEDNQAAIFPILGVLVWMHTGTYMVIFLANLQKLDASLVEAASIDGASEGQIFRNVIVPPLTGIFFTTAVFAIANSLRCFDLIFAMTGGGPGRYTEVIAIYMYTNTFKFFRYGFGNAAATAIVAVSVSLLLLLRFFSARAERKFE